MESLAAYLFLLCVYDCFPHMCVYVHVYMPGASGVQKRVSDILGLELQVVARHHLGAGDWIQVFPKSSKHV